MLGAVKRAIDRAATPNRFIVTGSANTELENRMWPGTGRLTRVSMYPMAIREQGDDGVARSFIDRVVDGGPPEPAPDTPDLAGYIELALRGGLPHPALDLDGGARADLLSGYLSDLLTHDVEQAGGSHRRDGPGRRRDPRRLRRYFETYAANSAGVVNHETIFDAAGVTKLMAA